MIELALWLWENKGDISFAAVIGVLLKHMWPYAKKRLHMDEVQEALQWAIPRIERLTGELYVTPTTRYSKQAQRRLKPLYRYLRMALSQGQTRARGSFIKSSGGRRMKINKAWMASIAVYFFAEIVKRYNVNLPTGWEETAYTIALYSIQYGAFALAALWNKYIHHKPVPTAPEQPVVEFKTYTDMVPIMQEVNSQINIMLEQISSGKHTQATQESINAYLKIHDLIKKKGA